MASFNVLPFDVSRTWKKTKTLYCLPSCGVYSRAAFIFAIAFLAAAFILRAVFIFAIAFQAAAFILMAAFIFAIAFLAAAFI